MSETRIDIGCPDFQAAAENRRRIKDGFALDWWRWYEAAVKYTPAGVPLGKDVPIGELPQVGKRRRARNYDGGE